jgi:hypothetical protein
MAADRDAAKHCQPFDWRSRNPDWPTPPQSGHSPSPVLAGHANDQPLNLSIDPRPARAVMGLRAIEFAGDKLAIPAQDSVRPGHAGDVGENLVAHAMTERASLGVRELQSPFQLRLHDAVLGG